MGDEETPESVQARVRTAGGSEVRGAGAALILTRWTPRRESERRPFSGSRKRASAGQGWRCVGSHTVIGRDLLT